MNSLEDEKNEELLKSDEQESKIEAEYQTGYVKIRKFPFIMLLLLTVILTAGVTLFAYSIVSKKEVNITQDHKGFEKLYAAYDMLQTDYYKKIDQQKLVNGAINGMFQSLEDPYSTYMNEQQAQKLNQSISSSFEGIGAEITEKDGFILIVTPIKGSPAEKAGLKPNDKVLAVDGKSLQGVSSSDAVNMIRGKKGTKVELTIQRVGVEGTTKVPIIRDTIPIETVYGEMMGDGIGKVQITSFSQNTTKELVKVLNDLQKQGMKGIVLDIRQNPGGLLNQAQDIASLFVPDGKVILKVQDRNGNIKEYTSSNKDNPKIPLVVVIDKGSASASEILAGAVHESAGVTLVGEKSFGKGTVQSVEDFKDGSNVKFTTAKWLTPNGNWIHGKGIKPDIEVALPSYAQLSVINPDTQLKLSSASNDVKTAQEMLKAVGFDPGRVDGFFDEGTKNAVIAFQKQENLEANGVISGKTTITLMERLRDKIMKNDPQIQKAAEVLKKQMGL